MTRKAILILAMLLGFPLWAFAVSQPPAAPSTPDMTAATDTGASNTDNITNDTAPGFTGTAEAHATVELFRDGATSLGTTTADEDGNWARTSAVIPDGTFQITATATNAYGTSPASDALTITIDTTAPAKPTAALDAASDSGVSNSDHITKYTTVTFVGTAEPFSTVRMSLVDGYPVPGGAGYPTTEADVNGDWTITCTVCTSNCNYHTRHWYRFKSTDAAGNNDSIELLISYDWRPPDATDTTPNPTPIVEATVGAGTFTLRITYDDERKSTHDDEYIKMNTAIDPTISFPAEDPTRTITLVSGAWTEESWDNPSDAGQLSVSVYTATYDVVDVDEQIPDIDVRIGGAQDIAGNVQNQTVADVFSVNTGGEPPPEGDVNGDGKIDLIDVRLCQQIAAGVIAGTAEQRQAADVDGDGDVDEKDAEILAEYVLGIRTTLP
ncbi:Ig-like domain-containing protein [Candidatus Bipolaricaulota bacterium]